MCKYKNLDNKSNLLITCVIKPIEKIITTITCYQFVMLLHKNVEQVPYNKIQSKLMI